MNQIIDQPFFDTLCAAFKECDINVDSKLEEAQNVQHVVDIIRLLVGKDFSALSEVFADDVALDIIGSPVNPMAGQTKGRQQVIEVTRRNFSLLEDQRVQIESVVAQGETVVVVAREQGRFAETGGDYDFHWVQVYTFKDGKLIYIREIADSAAFMGAAKP
jgi:ketosteroid isomerase-like protein